MSRASSRWPQLARLLGAWQAAPACAARRRLPDYVALAGAVRGLLIDGRLALGVRLPAERELAEALGISRTTVTAAYRDAARVRAPGQPARGRQLDRAARRPPRRHVRPAGAEPTTPDLHRPRLRGAARAARAAAGRGRGGRPTCRATCAGAGYHPTGHPGAARGDRRAVRRARGLPTDARADHDHQRRAARARPAAAAAVAPGSPVLVESPTYPNALAAFAGRAGPAQLLRHRSPTAGTTTCCSSTIRPTRRGLAYLIPDFHNPTGHLMPTRLRERLPAAAHAAGTDLVDRRVLRGPRPRRAADAAAGGLLRPARPGADDRRHEQAVLGRPAHRLDPRGGPARRAAGRGPGRVDMAVAGARPARRGRGCCAAPAHVIAAPAQLLAAQRDALVDALRDRAARVAVHGTGRRREPVGRAGRAGLQRAGPRRGRARRAARARAALRRRRHDGAVRAAAVHAAGGRTCARPCTAGAGPRRPGPPPPARSRPPPCRASRARWRGLQDRVRRHGPTRRSSSGHASLRTSSRCRRRTMLDDAPLDLHRRGQFAVLDGQVAGQDARTS